ncbi:hypothetical protein CC86DRAFT_32240, partial [Ophiobolus disseminans]
MHSYIHANPHLHQPVGRVRHGLDVRVGHRVELGVPELVVGPNLDEGALVACAVAVVGRREDGDAAAVVLDLIAVHAHLVRPDDCVEAVVLAETLGDVGPELQADAALAGPPAGRRLRICPEHLHHEPGLARLALLEAVELAHVVERDLVVGEQAAVQDKVLLADERGERQHGEGLGEQLEHALRVLRPALALKAVHAVHIVRLVVAAVEEEAARVQPLVGVQQQRDLGRPRAAVDKVAVEEEGVRRRGAAGELEDVQQVEELTVRVAADGDLVARGHVVLDHGGLRLDDVHDGQDDLVGVLLGQLLAVLEALHHVGDEGGRHGAGQRGAVVAGLEQHVVDVEALCGRRGVVDLDGLEEGVALDDALAFRHAQLRVGVGGGLADDELPVAQGLAVLENGRVGRGAAVVGLDAIGVERECAVGVLDGIAIRLELDVCLGAVGVEGGLLVVERNSLRVQGEGGGVVVLLEGLVAPVLELGSLFLRVPHGETRCGRGARGVRAVAG